MRRGTRSTHMKIVYNAVSIEFFGNFERSIIAVRGSYYAVLYNFYLSKLSIADLMFSLLFGMSNFLFSLRYVIAIFILHRNISIFS